MSSHPLRVLFLASEADPFVKVGGLGDVAGSLPDAIRRLAPLPGESSIDIRLAIPFHGVINRNAYPIDKLVDFDVPHESGPIRAEVYQTHQNGLPVYLIGGAPVPPSAPVYSNDSSFDAHKYIFFSIAALELTRVLDWQPHIVHANDWHTAAAVYALSLRRKSDPFFRHTATLLGVHNLPYLGNGSEASLAAFGLPPAEDTALPSWATHMPLPLGLLTSDRIVAVSPHYAREILTPEFGSGLQDFLQTRQKIISGILNGIDIQRWNPATDSQITANYSSEDLAPRLKDKLTLKQELGLDAEHSFMEDDTPLLGMITRMDYQKGVDLTLTALSLLIDRPWQAVILGTGQFELEAAARYLEQNYPNRVRAVIRFDPGLSRHIYAGADMLIMPSRYEPCGLAQMIAMRYGCVPIARATGGLRDTILDANKNADGTGFLFNDATPEALADALQRALNAYTKPTHWKELQRRGMGQDFTWERSAKEYVALYKKLMKR